MTRSSCSCFFCSLVLFSMFRICSVLHVPNLFCSLCSKIVLFSMFQTCSVLHVPNMFRSLYIPNLYVVGHHFSKIYIVFCCFCAAGRLCSCTDWRLASGPAGGWAAALTHHAGRGKAFWAFIISFKICFVFSRHLAVEQYCSLLWGKC